MLDSPFPRPFLLPVALLAGAAFALGPNAAEAATACYEDGCGACPVRGSGPTISTLIAPGEFPAGADTPTAFVDPGDGSGLRLVATQEGAILVWEGSTGEIRPDFFLDLRDDTGGPVLAGGERGLLALAVDPDYATTGHLYVFYTAASTGPGDQGDIVVERYSRSAADPALGDPTSDTTLLVIDHPAGNHNGGWLAFGPDGYLYVSTGDGGGFCDGNAGANGDGQQASTLSGKMLRIDVRGVDPTPLPPDTCDDTISTGPYMVPSDNPFTGMANTCDEVWALGLRNPFRFSFDRETGDLYIGDVGQNKWEEINLLPATMSAPVNFGWVCREGCETADNNESNCSVTGCPADAGTTCEFPLRTASGFRDPVLCHYNGGWDSIMGGYRYRGARVPSLGTSYVYGDAACGQIWQTNALDPANPAAIAAECLESGYGGTYGFAEDALGELYVVVGGAGRIDCFHEGDGCYWAGWGIFADGFESGDTSLWDVP